MSTETNGRRGRGLRLTGFSKRSILSVSSIVILNFPRWGRRANSHWAALTRSPAVAIPRHTESPDGEKYKTETSGGDQVVWRAQAAEHSHRGPLIVAFLIPALSLCRN